MTSNANSQGLSRPLASGADDAPAILAPDRPTLTHGGLRQLIGATAAALHARGIRRGDRVAIVLP
ncbi:MAG: AMP-dependent synthetase, partial [Mesorhizobium sp.]